jgi:hypothetical protein
LTSQISQQTFYTYIADRPNSKTPNAWLMAAHARTALGTTTPAGSRLCRMRSGPLVLREGGVPGYACRIVRLTRPTQSVVILLRTPRSVLFELKISFFETIC